jgi:hypothetical protein
MKLIRYGDAGRERRRDQHRNAGGVGLGMKPAPIYLHVGDLVELGIDRLGESRQRVVAYRESS